MRATHTVEVRTAEFVTVTDTNLVFFSGVGRRRNDINDGQPDVLNAFRRKGTVIDGRLRGDLKVCEIKGSSDWFSIREVGPKGNGRTVYLTGTAVLLIDGVDATVRQWIEDLREN